MKRKQSLLKFDGKRSLHNLLKRVEYTKEDVKEYEKKEEHSKSYARTCKSIINLDLDNYHSVMAKTGTVIQNLKGLQKHYVEGGLVQRHRLEEHFDSNKIQDITNVLNVLGLNRCEGIWGSVNGKAYQTKEDRNMYQRLAQGIVLKSLRPNKKDIYVCSKIISLPVQALTQIGIDSVGITCLTLAPSIFYNFPEPTTGEETSLFGKLAMSGVLVFASGLLFGMSHFLIPNEHFRSKNLFGKLAEDIEEKTQYVQDEIREFDIK